MEQIGRQAADQLSGAVPVIVIKKLFLHTVNQAEANRHHTVLYSILSDILLYHAFLLRATKSICSLFCAFLNIFMDKCAILSYTFLNIIYIYV